MEAAPQLNEWQDRYNRLVEVITHRDWRPAERIVYANLLIEAFRCVPDNGFVKLTSMTEANGAWMTGLSKPVVGDMFPKAGRGRVDPA